MRFLILSLDEQVVGIGNIKRHLIMRGFFIKKIRQDGQQTHSGTRQRNYTQLAWTTYFYFSNCKHNLKIIAVQR